MPIRSIALPLAFESDRTRPERQDDFLARGPGYRLALSPREATFYLAKAPATSPAVARRKETREQKAVSAGETLTMRLVGADASAHTAQTIAPTGHANYFLGKDRSQWHTDIPLYDRVEYRQVYQGIDLAYYGDQRQLEYDFRVHPGADPRRIGWKFAGARKIRIAPNGELVVRLKQTEVHWHKPLTYQMIAGKKRMVASAFVLKKGGEVGFQVARYDTSQPLTIDPKILYKQTFSNAVSVNSLAVDGNGNTYIAGDLYDTTSTFPVTPGAFQTARRSMFVAKLNSNGTAILYATYLGGSAGGDYANCIAIDNDGNAYLTGNAHTTDFPVTPGAFQTVNQASTVEVDLGYNAVAFVTKLNSTGSALAYSTFLGGHPSAGRADTGAQLVVDDQGSAYVAGTANSADFPTTPGALQSAPPNAGSGANGFITKLNPAGTALIYSTYLSGNQGSYCNALALSSKSEVYVTGFTASTNFPTTPGAFQTSSRLTQAEQARGISTAFVSRLNAAGTALLYSTYLGGSGAYGESGNGIVVDTTGAAYVTGSTTSLDFPTTPGVFQPNPPAVGDSNGGAFVTKLNPGGSALVYSTYLGYASGTAIAIDSAGSAYVLGNFFGTEVPTTLGAFQRRQPNIGFSGFLSRLNAAGTALLYGTILPASVRSGRIAVDDFGTVTVAGQGIVERFAAQPIFPDFNRDGSADLLLLDSATGVIGTWFMNGSQVQGGVTFSQIPPPTYTLIGTGDFQGDGSTTLVFQDTVDNRVIFWYTGGANNATITGGEYVYPTPTPGWKLVGVADFNQDGRSDLLFQDTKTGKLAIWKMKGPFYQGGLSLETPPYGGGKVVGVGDFDKDGFADILIQQPTTGRMEVWFMQGTTRRYVFGDTTPQQPEAGWKVVAVGDCNGDGWPDLLFQNAASAQTAIWYMKGLYYQGGTSLSLLMPTGWSIVGPH